MMCFFSDIPLNLKLLLSFVLVSLVTFITFSGYSAHRVRKTLEGQLITSTGRNLEQSAAFLRYQMEYVEDALDIIALDRTVNAIISQEGKSLPLVEQMEDKMNLDLYFISFNKYGTMADISLFLNDTFIFSHEGNRYFTMEQAQDNPWFEDLENLKGKTLWTPSVKDEGLTFSAVRFIRNLDDYTRIVGVIKIDLNREAVMEILMNTSPAARSISYLERADGTVFTPPGDDPAHSVRLNGAEPGEGSLLEMGGILYFAGVLEIGSDWRLVSLSPMEEVTRESRLLIRELLIIMILFLALSYFLALGLSRNITDRLTRIVNSLRNLHKGIIPAGLDDLGRDEIGEIARDVKAMAGEINALMEEKYQAGLHLKGAELKALQAQINPHFLYNTLEMINCSALENQVPFISQTVLKLSRFYKLSLSGGRDMVSLKEEMDHVRLYLEIQNMRFDNPVEMSLELPPELEEIRVPKIILQPLAENSLLHGIVPLESGKGKLTIVVRVKKKDLVISVTDNGVGCPVSPLKEKPDGGYGVSNIQERLQLIYGQGYGLTYHNHLPRGTQVILKINLAPKRTEFN